MTIMGAGAIAIWNGIRPEGAAEFLAWHNRKHMPERVAIPGFARGRRFVALDRRLSYFTLYELDTVGVATSDAYNKRLASPTPWTQAVVPHFTDTERALCRVHSAMDIADGGSLATIRLAGVASAEGLDDLIRRAVRDLVESVPEIVSVSLLFADMAASQTETKESRARKSPTGVPEATILIEGTDALAVSLQAQKHFCAETLSAISSENPAVHDVFLYELTLHGDQAADGNARGIAS